MLPLCNHGPLHKSINSLNVQVCTCQMYYILQLLVHSIRYFVVGAKTLNASASPHSSVKEGTTGIFKCSSDEGNPPPVIHWDQGTGVGEEISGRFYASKTESTLLITVNRTMNQKEISCYIKADESKGQKRLEDKITLSVKCESFITFYLGEFVFKLL